MSRVKRVAVTPGGTHVRRNHVVESEGVISVIILSFRVRLKGELVKGTKLVITGVGDDGDSVIW